MRIQTQRLIIRELKKTDAIAMYHYAKKPHIGPMAGWQPHTSLSETKQILSWIMQGNDVYAITLLHDDWMIGTVGLHNRKHTLPYEHVRELGYVLDDDYWGLGIMPEAAKAMIHYGFYEMGLDAIVVGHKRTNQQSRRVIEKLGFTFTHFETRTRDDGPDEMITMYQLERNTYEQKL